MWQKCAIQGTSHQLRISAQGTGESTTLKGAQESMNIINTTYKCHKYKLARQQTHCTHVHTLSCLSLSLSLTHTHSLSLLPFLSSHPLPCEIICRLKTTSHHIIVLLLSQITLMRPFKTQSSRFAPHSPSIFTRQTFASTSGTSRALAG